VSYTREEMIAAARFEAEASRGLRCRCIDRDVPGHSHDAPDPMAAPHVVVTVPVFGGSVRLRSASGGLESLWISLHDEAGREVAFDDATRSWRAAPVRLTPNDARELARLLRRYAATHKDTADE